MDDTAVTDSGTMKIPHNQAGEEGKMNDELICFCFQHTKRAIIDDVIAHQGASSIMRASRAEKKDGNCRCAETNPKGR